MRKLGHKQENPGIDSSVSYIPLFALNSITATGILKPPKEVFTISILAR